MARQPVEATERVEMADLLGMHARAGISLRILPSIWPFWEFVVQSTLAFSGCRLKNAAADPGHAPREGGPALALGPADT